MNNGPPRERRSDNETEITRRLAPREEIALWHDRTNDVNAT